LASASRAAPPAANPTAASPLSWDGLGFNHYPSFIANLRRLGFPEEVIRDIVIGAINRRYRPRLAALRSAGTPYWQAYSRRSRRRCEESRKLAAAMRDLETERDRLIRDLLGVVPAEYFASWSDKPDRITDLLGNVSETVRPQAREVLQRYDDLERAVAERAGGTLGLTEQADLQQLYRDKLKELAGILSPQEIEEIELRTSPLAIRLLGTDLVGFPANEREFREIFRVRKAVEEQFGPGTQSGSALAPDLQDQLLQAADAQLRQALGEKRSSSMWTPSKATRSWTTRRG
jgi:hypothetical protein